MIHTHAATYKGAHFIYHLLLFVPDHDIDCCIFACIEDHK